MSTRVAKTDEELRQIALDWVGGSIFSDRHIMDGDKPEMIRSVFMPLFFADEEFLKTMRDDNVAMFYEHMDNAGNRSINGYPVFMQMKTLTADEVDRLAVYIDQLNGFKQSGALEKSSE